MNVSFQACASHDATANPNSAGNKIALAPVVDDVFAALHEGAGVCVMLDQLGVIDVSGEDAASFLHTQLTNDIQGLETGSVRLAGYCSPKGRLLASMHVWRASNVLRLLLSADLVAQIQKRLSMFVLRAKARLTDASGAVAVAGFAGNVRMPLSQCFDALPDGVHAKIDGPLGALMRVPDADGLTRYLWVGPRADMEAKLIELDTAYGLRRSSAALWDWLDIRAGEPRVSAATCEQFVPQTVNFERVGGISFQKGCYPGQEVVARAQYRGAVKRRTMLAHTDHAQVGAPLFHSDDPGQPCGMVVNAAPAPHAGMDCLVQLKLSVSKSGSIHVGSPEGPLLRFLPLPYSLPASDSGD